ncbi:hypothetical protein [Mesorhizobium sp.]|uniref:hypothetical protein n=1 Tax=Mesorhizobium sp. TaxID=1871066 RepID=UPI000FE5767D|nr:hypothetical protein [Mesorhizobium sp.]RWM26882.1 MAG: hypothetical protein EOR74_13830 [Mesorhizobium sp.]
MEISADQNYTLAEAAAHLRLTNRGVAKLARRHGLCMVRGRDILLTGKDIEAIKDVLRVAPTLPRQIPIPAISDYRLHASLIALSRKKRRNAV